MDKERLYQFIDMLREVKLPGKDVFDLGLIVSELQGKINPENIFNELKSKIGIEKIIYDESITDEGIIDKIVGILEKKEWIFIEIKKDIKSPFLNQLKHLANYNSVQLIGYKGNDVFQMPIPDKSRIIVFAERDFIEDKISYPHFYRLFGPVLSI